jgi:hypothetical protein
VPESRSRKTFRWMPAPVVEHNLRPDSVRAPAPSGATKGQLASSFGRGLYGKKLARGESDAAERADAIELSGLARMPLTLLRWQLPLRYLIVWQRRDFTLTWHAPWCRSCDCPGAGWQFQRDAGYVSGLGFELSFARE